MGPDSQVRFPAASRAYPAAANLRGLTAHLVFGLVVAAVTEAAWVLSGRRPDRPASPPPPPNETAMDGFGPWAQSAIRKPSQYASTRGRRLPRSLISRTSGDRPARGRKNTSIPAS